MWVERGFMINFQEQNKHTNYLDIYIQDYFSKIILPEKKEFDHFKLIGKFIVIEGHDCSGKSSIINSLEKMLNVPIKVINFPTDGQFGQDFMNLLSEALGDWDNTKLQEKIAQTAFKDFEDCYKWIENLKKEYCVISDRYYPSTFAYQGSAGVPKEYIRRLIKETIKNSNEPNWKLKFNVQIPDDIFILYSYLSSIKDRMAIKQNEIDLQMIEQIQNIKLQYINFAFENNATLIESEDSISAISQVILNYLSKHYG
jgi:thymidylate kinase